jgi:transcriptional regulator GlxA family with amidase domain
LVRSSAGIQILAEPLPAKSLLRHATLIIAGGAGVEAAMQDEILVHWLHQAADSAGRVCSVCTGAFLLACRGLLDDRDVVTHWRHLKHFADRFPLVRVHGNSIFVKSDRFYSSAGVTAGIDLCLYLVEENHDRQIALSVAKRLVVHLKRPGGQLQFSSELLAQSSPSQLFASLVQKIKENPGRAWSVEEMASLAHMATRSFHRRFVAEMQVTPSQFIAATRLEAASALIESSKSSLKTVARKAGFGSEVNMKNAFRKVLGVTPTEYMERFRR